MTTDTVFSIVSILVVRITKVGYGWKANEFIFPTILRYVMYITYRVFLKMTKVDAFFLAHLIVLIARWLGITDKIRSYLLVLLVS